MEMRVPCFAGSSPPFLGRERAAVDVDVGPERRSPRYHETVFLLRVLKTAARRYVNRDVCVTGCACCVVQNVRKRSSPGARVETTGAAARNESAASAGDGRQEVQVTAQHAYRKLECSTSSTRS